VFRGAGVCAEKPLLSPCKQKNTGNVFPNGEKNSFFSVYLSIPLTVSVCLTVTHTDTHKHTTHTHTHTHTEAPEVNWVPSPGSKPPPSPVFPPEKPMLFCRKLSVVLCAVCVSMCVCCVCVLYVVVCVSVCVCTKIVPCPLPFSFLLGNASSATAKTHTPS
jgi:hypothetical protein